MNDGLAECCNGNRLEEDLLDVQQCIGQANSNSFPESSIGTKTWLQTRGSGWWRWTILNFVQRSRVLFTPVFALVRALKRAALPACEPQTQTQ